MTIDKAREFIQVQVGFGSGYNRNATKLILAEVEKVHGAEAVHRLIDEFRLDELFDLKKGMKFSR